MSVPGFFGFEVDLSPHWEGFIQALMLILAILLFSVRNCLKDESCQAVVAKAEEIQDRISETECSGRLDARVRKKIKERGPSRNSKEVKMGENIGPQGQKLSGINNKKKGKNSSLYSLQELKALQIESDHESEHENKSSGSGEEVEELDTEEEVELANGRAMRSSQTAHPPPYRLRPPPIKLQPYV